MLAALNQTVEKQRQQIKNLRTEDQKNRTTTALEIYVDEMMDTYLQNPKLPPLFLENLKKELPYVKGMKFPRTSTHIGELKLCIAEFQFLWQVYQRALLQTGVKTVSGADNLPLLHNIYCGAAPNFYAQLINFAFKSKDIFIDPNPFHVTDMPLKERAVNTGLPLKERAVNTGQQTYLGLPITNAPVYMMWDNRRKDGKPNGTILERDQPHEDIVPLEECRRIMREIVVGGKGIYIINAYMTEDLARAIAETIGQIEPVNIQSDIRTNMTEMVGQQATEPDTLDLIFNYAQTYIWIETIRKFSKFGIGLVSVKFRHPFYEDLPVLAENVAKSELIKSTLERATNMPFAGKDTGIDFLTNALEKRLVFYAPEHVWLQVYCGESSTETRLITTCDKLYDYGTPESYDNKFAVYNNIHRWLQLYKNNYACPSRGFDLCADCSITAYCLEQYFMMIEVQDIQKAIHDTLDMLKVFTHRPLFIRGHGYLFRRMPYETLIEFLRNYNSQYTSHDNQQALKQAPRHASRHTGQKKYDPINALSQKYKQEALSIKLDPPCLPALPMRRPDESKVKRGAADIKPFVYGGYSTVLSETDRQTMDQLF